LKPGWWGAPLVREKYQGKGNLLYEMMMRMMMVVVVVVVVY
jgi:hypothetical protein